MARAAGDLLEWTREVRPESLADVVSALGGLGEPSLGPPVAALAGYPDTDVRVVVAQVLGELRDCSDDAVDALVLLSCDRVDEVRSWATFALGAPRLSGTRGVDDALVARLGDSCEEVRVEAARALVRQPA